MPYDVEAWQDEHVEDRIQQAHRLVEDWGAQLKEMADQLPSACGPQDTPSTRSRQLEEAMGIHRLRIQEKCRDIAVLQSLSRNSRNFLMNVIFAESDGVPELDAATLRAMMMDIENRQRAGKPTANRALVCNELHVVLLRFAVIQRASTPMETSVA